MNDSTQRGDGRNYFAQQLTGEVPEPYRQPQPNNVALKQYSVPVVIMMGIDPEGTLC